MENTQLRVKADYYLKNTSRTFYLPINDLPDKLKEAVTSAYLCLRAIDEIEDHPDLSSEAKVQLLETTSKILKKNHTDRELIEVFAPYKASLEPVSIELTDWLKLCPPTVRDKVIHSTSEMAFGMAEWIKRDWNINTVTELERYTYCVAGAVGVLLSDIWQWYTNIETNKEEAIAFGRGLQAVNIVRNRKEDLNRGVDFFPIGWKNEDMIAYAYRNLSMAEKYVEKLDSEPIYNFCRLPLALAYGSLKVISSGYEKLSRTEVEQIVKGLSL